MANKIFLKTFAAALLAAPLLLSPVRAGGFPEQATWAGGSGGSTNAQTISIANVSSLSDLIGVPISFQATFTNTGATTLSVSGQTATAVKTATPNGIIALTGGEIAATNPVTVIYDGTEFLITTFNGYLPGTPLPLLANATYYVNASGGSDSNNCTSSGTACLTVGHALTLVQKLNLNGFTVTVNVANGTYPAFTSPYVNGVGTIFITGNLGTPHSVVVNATSGSAVYVNGPNYQLGGISVASAANGSSGDLSCGIRLNSYPAILNDIEYRNTVGCQIAAIGGGAYALLTGTQYIANGATTAHLYAYQGGLINLVQASLNITGSVGVAFTNFAQASQLGSIQGPYTSVSGLGASGSRYLAQMNGIIETGGSGANYFPGSTAGSTQTGGQYE